MGEGGDVGVKPGAQKEVCSSTKDEDCDGKVGAADPDCPTCVDKKKNGLETDVDCGGGVCPACASGELCKVSKDCATGLGCCGGKCTSLATATNCGACRTSCSGMMACTKGQCTCPSNMVKTGQTCVEDFNGASPATGWIWSKVTKDCPIFGCTSTATSASCKGCAKCTISPVTSCGNIGWQVLASPKSGGGKAIQVFTYATSGNCWQGDSLNKTYTIGRTVSATGRSIKLYLAGAGAGATWQCGNLRIALLKAGTEVGSKYYKDSVYGSYACSGTLLGGNKKDFTFDLGALFGAKDFDAIKLSLHKYSCVSGHWHTVTVDDIVMWSRGRRKNQSARVAHTPNSSRGA